MVVAGAFIGVMLLVVVAFTRVEFRRITPLVFRCQRCTHEFQQPPQRRYPRACPKCRARDWYR